VTLTAALYLIGCPQLADDSFDKVAGDDDTHSASGGQKTTSNTGTSVTGQTLGGVGATGAGSIGGNEGSGNGGSGDTGSVGAGAPGTETGSVTSATGSTSSSTTTTTGGTGGSSELPTTLVYATTDDVIYSAEWDGVKLGVPTEWAATENTIAFVEARLAPDRSWAVAAFQGDGDDTCDLQLYRHFGAETALAETVGIGEPQNCLTARAFDVAFEQESGRALLVYALPGGELGYELVEAGSVSDRKVLAPAVPGIAINWVRAVSDSASDRIVVGFSAEGGMRNSLFALEWDGSQFEPPHELVRNGVILGAESFDFAYYEGQLIALRGDDMDDGVGYRLREADGEWLPEDFRPNALNGNAQVIELRTMPYGIAGALFDATGTVTSFGTVLWQDGGFVEETRLDNSLPAVANFEPASLKADIQRLGDAAITVYANDYDGAEDARSSLGWAVLRPDTEWTAQQETLPMNFEQESEETVTRSIRLSRFTAQEEGLVLAFAEDRGLYVNALTDLGQGFTEPVLVDENVDGLATTPFAWIGP